MNAPGGGLRLERDRLWGEGKWGRAIIRLRCVAVNGGSKIRIKVLRRGIEERLDGGDDGERLVPLAGTDQAPGDRGQFDNGGEFADGAADDSKVRPPGLLADDVKTTNCGAVVEVSQQCT